VLAQARLYRQRRCTRQLSDICRACEHGEARHPTSPQLISIVRLAPPQLLSIRSEPITVQKRHSTLAMTLRQSCRNLAVSSVCLVAPRYRSAAEKTSAVALRAQMLSVSASPAELPHCDLLAWATLSVASGPPPLLRVFPRPMPLDGVQRPCFEVRTFVPLSQDIFLRIHRRQATRLEVVSRGASQTGRGSLVGLDERIQHLSTLRSSQVGS
jgi:hypothetical protein